MTDICVKIYRCHLLYARKYRFALLLWLLLLLLLLWHICISDVTSSLIWPLYPEQYRSSETIGLRRKDTLQLNETKQTFYQVQGLKLTLIPRSDILGKNVIFSQNHTEINSDDWTITKKTNRTIKHENLSKMKILKVDRWALPLRQCITVPFMACHEWTISGPFPYICYAYLKWPFGPNSYKPFQHWIHGMWASNN